MPVTQSNRDLTSLISDNWIGALDHIELLPRLRPGIERAVAGDFSSLLLPQILGALCNAVVGKTTVPRQIFTNAPEPVAVAGAKHLNTNARWTGTATELLLYLRAIDSATTWPATPKGLTQLIRRTPLPNITFQSHTGSRRKRSVFLQKITAPNYAQRRHRVGLSAFIRGPSSSSC